MPDLLAPLIAALSDRYRIERELGAGGMATVYLAEDLKHHRRVALKVLRPELAHALGPERFLREIETTAALHHPHILPLYDSGSADDFLYYVMPFVEGESLRASLFDVSGFDASAPHANYDVSPDGSWFVFARRGGTNHIVVLQNVPELARRIARGGNVP